MVNHTSLEIYDTKRQFPKLYGAFFKLPGIIARTIILFVGITYLYFIGQGSHSSQSNNFVYRAVFVCLIFYVWRIVRGIEFVIGSMISVFYERNHRQADFTRVLQGKPETSLEKQFAKKIPVGSQKKLYHRLIIPTYKEGFDILNDTLHHISQAEYDKNAIAVTVAGEERDIKHFQKIYAQLEKKWSTHFAYFDYTIHPSNLPDEYPGKGANLSYHAKKLYPKILDFFDTTAENIMVTTLDADTNIDKQYLTILTYYYLLQPDPKYISFQPFIFFYNNFRDAPIFSKIVSLMNSLRLVFNAAKTRGMRNFSTHAQVLTGLIETNFWSRQSIVEDGHQYRRSYFAFNGNHLCIPIFARVYQDSNLNNTTFQTMKAQYNQMRRRSHGAEDIPYVLIQRRKNRKTLPFRKTVYEWIKLLESILLRSTLHVILTMGFILTQFEDIRFGTAARFGDIISYIISFSYAILVFGIVFQIIYLPRHLVQTKKKKLQEGAQFFFLYPLIVGVVFFFFIGIPALHTQTAMLINKPMQKFNVTKKVRKDSSNSYS